MKAVCHQGQKQKHQEQQQLQAPFTQVITEVQAGFFEELEICLQATRNEKP
jgi:hypothetical protein